MLLLVLKILSDFTESLSFPYYLTSSIQINIKNNALIVALHCGSNLKSGLNLISPQCGGKKLVLDMTQMMFCFT